MQWHHLAALRHYDLLANNDGLSSSSANCYRFVFHSVNILDGGGLRTVRGVRLLLVLRFHLLQLFALPFT